MYNLINQNNSECLWGDFSLELGYIAKEQGYPDGNPKRIFDFEYPFYDEKHRDEFERKFLLHFYFHEIGQETIGRFKKMLRDTLTLNYDKYLHYYNIYLKTLEMPWWNNKDYYVDLTEVIDKMGNEMSKENKAWRNDATKRGSTSSSNNSHSSSSSVNSSSSLDINKYLDTPQGKVQNLDDSYLTTVTQDDNHEVDNTNSETNSNGNDTSTNENEDHKTGDLSGNNTKDTKDNSNKTHKAHEYGNIGVQTAGDIVKSWWKDACINLDKIIFEDCDELFMQVYGGFCD